MTPFEIKAEQFLLGQLKLGDAEAFTALYDRYKDRMAWRLLYLLKSETLVEDVFQDLFIKVWTNREHIDLEKSFSAYLYRIAENLVYDLFRKAASDQKLQEHLMVITVPLYDNAETLIIAGEQREQLYQVIEQLPPQQKEVFRLCKLEEKSYEEVAMLLGISTATVNVHLTRANRFIRAQLSATLGAYLITGWFNTHL